MFTVTIIKFCLFNQTSTNRMTNAECEEREPLDIIKIIVLVDSATFVHKNYDV